MKLVAPEGGIDSPVKGRTRRSRFGLWPSLELEPSVVAGVLIPLGFAERGGFEPPIPERYAGFRDQCIQPLCHLSKRSAGRVEFNQFLGLMGAPNGGLLPLQAGNNIAGAAPLNQRD